jgi:hypothetical protein
MYQDIAVETPICDPVATGTGIFESNSAAPPLLNRHQRAYSASRNHVRGLDPDGRKGGSKDGIPWGGTKEGFHSAAELG